MKKLNPAMILIALAVIFTGCKLDNMIKLAQENDLSVNPNPLEVHGGNIAYEMSAELPPKILPSSTSFTINQIYVYGTEEIAVGSTEFRAEDFPNSSTTASRKAVTFDFPYVEGMNPGTLYIEGVATDTRSGKSKTGERLAVAQGLILTSQWVQDVVYASYEIPEYNDKEEIIPTNVNFYFDQGKSKLRTSLEYDGVTNKTKRDDLNAFIAEKNVTRTVTITGTHSPEGKETINSDLASDRAQTIEKYYKAQMDKYDYKGVADSIDFIIKPVVQDWAAFKGALVAYNEISSTEKDQYTKIINGSGTFEDKEKELKALASYKSVFKNVYPGLRTAKTEVLTVKPKKTNAQIAVLAKAIVNGEVSADTLSEEELMFSATLTPSIAEKAGIYAKVAEEYGSWQAHNDLAATHIEMAIAGDMSKLDGASTQLEIASKKNPNSGIIMSNMAAVQILQGNYEAATATLEGVSSASNEVMARVNSMKGSINVRNGEYDAAKTALNRAVSDSNSDINKGLAYLLSGSLNEAKVAFSAASEGDETGIADYLLAVTAARQENGDEITANLKNSILDNPDMKDKALNDLEFAKYATEVNGVVK